MFVRELFKVVGGGGGWGGTGAAGDIWHRNSVIEVVEKQNNN